MKLGLYAPVHVQRPKTTYFYLNKQNYDSVFHILSHVWFQRVWVYLKVHMLQRHYKQEVLTLEESLQG